MLISPKTFTEKINYQIFQSLKKKIDSPAQLYGSKSSNWRNIIYKWNKADTEGLKKYVTESLSEHSFENTNIDDIILEHKTQKFNVLNHL